MKVKYIDNNTPRSDGKSGEPTDITLGETYTVVSIIEESGQIQIINDAFKLCRYSQFRFVTVDDSPIEELTFNQMSSKMRSRLKRVEKLLGKMCIHDQIMSKDEVILWQECHNSHYH